VNRDALYQVFQELNQDGVMEFHDFLLVMHEYKPRMRELNEYSNPREKKRCIANTSISF